MNPTLNSPKYAAPESLDYRLHKIQQERKNRKKFVPQLEQRYFRRNEGTTDYATIPEVVLAGDWEFSVDFYEFGDLGGRFIFANYDSVSGSYGLNLYSSGDYSAGAGKLTLFSFSGTPTITGLSKNTFYSVRYKSVGGFVSAYLNGVLFDEGIVVAPSGISSANQAAVWGIPQGSGFRLEGIIANLKIYDAGTLVRDYPLNDNSSTIRDLANGQDGTIINGNADDWGLFDRQADGDWKGNGLAVPPWDSVDQVLVTA